MYAWIFTVRDQIMYTISIYWVIAVDVLLQFSTNMRRKYWALSVHQIIDKELQDYQVSWSLSNFHERNIKTENAEMSWICHFQSQKAFSTGP